MPALPALGEQALPTPSAARCVDAPFFGTECRQLKCDVHARAKRGGDLTDNYALDLLYHTTIRIRTKRLARRHAQLRRLCNEVHSDHHAFRKRLRARSGDVPNSSSLCNRGMPTVRRLQICSCQTLQSCHPFPSPCNWLLLSIALMLCILLSPLMKHLTGLRYCRMAMPPGCMAYRPQPSCSGMQRIVPVCKE